MGTPISFDIFARDVNASRTFDNVADSAESSGSRMGKLAGWAKTGAVALGALGIAGGAVGLKTAAGMENAEIAFTTMLGSAEKADAFIRSLADFAAKTPFEFPELQTAASSLVSAGIEADKVIPIMTTLGDVTSGMGTGSEGVQRATVALQQMSAAGRITGEDLNQLRDAGIPVYDLLSKATGKSKAEVVALAQAGKLGANELGQMMKALESGKGLERFSGLMEKQSASLGGVWSTLMDTVNMGLAGAIQPALPAIKSLVLAVSDGIGPAMAMVSDGIGSAVDMFGRLRGAGGGAGGFASDLRSIADSARPLAGQVLTNLRSGFSAFLDAAKQVGGVVKRDLLPAVRDIAPVVAPVAKALLAFAGNNLVAGFKIVGSVISGLVTSISGFMNVISGILTGDWSRVWQGVGQIVMGPINAVKGTVSAFGGALRASFGGIASSVGGAWSGLWRRVRALPGQVMSATVGLVRGGLSRVRAVFTAAVRAVSSLWTSGFNRVRSITGSVIGAVTGIVGRGLSAVRGAVSRGASAAAGAMRSGMSRLGSAVSSGIGRAVGFFRSLPGRAVAALSGLTSRLSGIGGDIVDGLVNGIRNGVGRVMDAARGLADAIPGPIRKALGIESPSRVMMRVGGWVTEGLAKGIVGPKQVLLETALKRLVSSVARTRDRLRDLVTKRDDFAGGFAGLATSVFGADFGETGPVNMSQLLAQSRGDAVKASAYRRDVARAIKLGLSDNLLRDLQSQGEAGRAALSVIASQGTKASVATLNRNDASADRAYRSAGMSAANEIYGGRIADARSDLRMQEAVERGMRRALAADRKDKNNRTVIYLDGKELRQAQVRDERNRGKKK